MLVGWIVGYWCVSGLVLGCLRLCVVLFCLVIVVVVIGWFRYGRNFGGWLVWCLV